MALLSSPAPPSVRAPSAFLRLPPVNRRSSALSPNPNPNFIHLDRRRVPESVLPFPKRRGWTGAVAASNILEQEASLMLRVDRESFSVREAVTEEEVEAAVRLRIRTFYEFNQASWGLEDHKRCLVEREFEALKDRLSGNRIGFKRVACINAILPLSPSWGLGDELCTTCKFSEDGKDQVVVGTLDLNQCLGLADELTGRRPVGSGTNVTRAYLSNVCVAEELQRNGLGHALVSKSKKVARQWGITDLYVHVAVDNEAAQRLYQKSGFIYEDEEPAWQARFLGRPRRFLLWADLTKAQL